jgi:uncharacterized membrane protein YfcA
MFFFESTELAVYYIAILFFAYFVRGIAGFGSALIAVPLLTLKFDFIVVVPVIAVLDYCASVGQGISDRKYISVSDLWPLFPFTFTGVCLGVYLLSRLETRVMALCLAAFIICFAVYSLFPVQEQRGGRWLAVPAGFMGGVVGAVFGTGGPFYVMYFRLRGLDKTRFRATISVSFVVDGSLRIVGFILTQVLSLSMGILILCSVPLVWFGMFAGGRVHLRISQQGFARIVSLILLGSGMALLWKHL